jgi:hypothetical protein
LTGILPGVQDVGRTNVAVVHVVRVQVVHVLLDGEGDVEFYVQRSRFAYGQLLLQRDVHALHV